MHTEKSFKRLNKRKIEKVIYGRRINTYNCFTVFFHASITFSDYEYWYALGRAYTYSDNLYQLRQLVKYAFTRKLRGRFNLMTKGEREMYHKLPERIKIHRAMTVREFRSKDFGLSWTLDYSVAEFFKDKYMRNHSTKHLPKLIHTIEIDKSDVIAFFNGRNESEIIYLHSNKLKQSTMTNSALTKKFTKMNSRALLAVAAKGNMTIQSAEILSTILGRRLPCPTVSK